MSDLDNFDDVSTDIPEGWRPTEGSIIVGTVIRSTMGYSDQSEDYYPILIVHDERTDSDISVHAFHSVLKKRLAELKPNNGERIGIKMGAKVPLKSNPQRSVQTYVVKVEGRDESVDWDKIGQQAVPKEAEEVSEEQAKDEDLPF